MLDRLVDKLSGTYERIRENADQRIMQARYATADILSSAFDRIEDGIFFLDDVTEDITDAKREAVVSYREARDSMAKIKTSLYGYDLDSNESRKAAREEISGQIERINRTLEKLTLPTRLGMGIYFLTHLSDTDILATVDVFHPQE